MLDKLIKFIKRKKNPSKMLDEAYSPFFNNIAKGIKKRKRSSSFIFRKENQTNEQMEEEAIKDIKECELLGWKLIDYQRYVYEDTETIGLIILIYERIEE